MCQTNVQIIAGELLAHRLKLGAVGKCPRKSAGDIRTRQFTEGRGLVGQFHIERPNRRVKVGPDGPPEHICRLFQGVFRLDDPHAPRSNLRLRAINVQGRQGPQAEGLLVMVITLLRFIERLFLHLEIFPREYDSPIISHDLENNVAHFCLKHRAGLPEVSLCDQNRRAIRKESKIANQRLGKCELDCGCEGWIHGVKGTVCRKLVGAKGRLKTRARRKGLLIAQLSSLRQIVQNRCALKLRGRQRFRPGIRKAGSRQRVERSMRAAKIVLSEVDPGVIEQNIRIVCESQADAIVESENHLPVHDVIFQALRCRQWRCCFLPRAAFVRRFQAWRILPSRRKTTHQKVRHGSEERTERSHQSPPGDFFSNR